MKRTTTLVAIGIGVAVLVAATPKKQVPSKGAVMHDQHGSLSIDEAGRVRVTMAMTFESVEQYEGAAGRFADLLADVPASEDGPTQSHILPMPPRGDVDAPGSKRFDKTPTTPAPTPACCDYCVTCSGTGGVKPAGYKGTTCTACWEPGGMFNIYILGKGREVCPGGMNSGYTAALGRCQ